MADPYVDRLVTNQVNAFSFTTHDSLRVVIGTVFADNCIRRAQYRRSLTLEEEMSSTNSRTSLQTSSRLAESTDRAKPPRVLQAPSGDAGRPNDRVAIYQRAEEARIAVKLLINNGFDADQLFVLCTDRTRDEEFRSRLMPSGADQLESAPVVAGGAGAAIGAGVLGGLGLAAGGVGAAAGAAVGAAAGAGIGAMLGAGTYKSDDAKRLHERFRRQLENGAIIVVLRPREGKDNEERLARADRLLGVTSRE